MSEIHSDHRARMFKRVQETKFEGFNDHEVLEYLLYYTIPRLDTNPLAHRLTDHFGSFAKVLEADENALCQVKGIGTHSASLLSSLLPIMRYYQRDKEKEAKKLDSCEKLIRYCVPLFYGLKDEKLYVLALDGEFNLLKCEMVGEGTANAFSVSARKIAEFAFRMNAINIVLAHNHPNGSILPSKEDIIATTNLKKLLAPFDIILADHIIVSGNEGLSLFDTNRL